MFRNVIFGTKPKKGQKKNNKGQGVPRLERCCGLEGFQTESANSWLGDNAHRRLRSVCCTCETNGKINLN